MLITTVMAVVAPLFAIHQTSHSASIRPAIVEDGSNFMTYHFPGNEPTSVAFTPDGNAFALTRGGLLKIAPNGAESYLPFYGASFRSARATRNPQSSTGGSIFGDDIVYSNGYLWFNGYHGIVRVHPDGTGHRYYQFGRVKTGFDDAGPLIASPDGIYFLASEVSYEPDAYHVVIGHLSNKFVLTVAAVAPAIGYQFPTLVWAPDDHLDYLAFYQVNNYPSQTLTNVTDMYQLQADGSSIHLGATNGS